MGHANRLLDWQENLTSDEHPPEWMLPFDDELVGWFDQVRRNRKSGYTPPDDDDEDDGMMTVNELAKGRR